MSALDKAEKLSALLDSNDAASWLKTATGESIEARLLQNTVGFLSRQAFVLVQGLFFAGALVQADGLFYVKDGGSAIVDLPGWSPFGGVHVRHLGIVGAADGASLAATPDETALIATAWELASNMRLPLEFDAFRQYGFTNFNKTLPGGYFKCVGTPKFVQKSTRVATTSAWTMGGYMIGATVIAGGDAVQGSNQFPVANAALIKPGMLADIRGRRLLAGDHRFNRENGLRQIARVRSVSGNVVEICDTLRWPYRRETVIATGTATAGESGKITIAPGLSFNDIWNFPIRIVGGTGAGQERYVHDYDPATGVVDIGTGFTGFPAAPWATIPNATSVYEIYDQTDVDIINPAELDIDAKWIGYSPINEVVRGITTIYCSHAKMRARCADFSMYGHYDQKNYKSDFHIWTDRANNCTASGGGLGYGMVCLASYGSTYYDPKTQGCRTGMDVSNGAIGTKIIGGTFVGGGKSFDGANLFPGQNLDVDGVTLIDGYANDGMSSHTGAVDTVWTNCTVRDCYYFAKNRSENEKYIGCVQEGAWRQGINVSYTRGPVISNCHVAPPGMTWPLVGINQTAGTIPKIEPGDVDPYASVAPYKAMFGEAMVTLRCATLLPGNCIIVDGCTALGVTQALVFLRDERPEYSSRSPNISVRNCKVGAVSQGANVLGIVKSQTALGTASIALRGLESVNNQVVIGGSTIGTIYSDNLTLLPVLQNLTNDALLVPVGPGRYIAHMKDDTYLYVGPGAGAKVHDIFLCDISNASDVIFKGTVRLGDTTPDNCQASRKVTLRTDSLNGTMGTDGYFNLSCRSAESLYILENRLGTKVLMSFELKGTVQ